jgi:hypothetical protein
MAICFQTGADIRTVLLEMRWVGAVLSCVLE